MALDWRQTWLVSQWPTPGPLTCCRIDPQQRYAFCGSEDQKIYRVALADGQVTPLAGHESWPAAFGFADGGETLLSGGCDGKLCWWQAASAAPTPVRSIQAHAGWIRGLVVSPDGKHVATAGNDKVLRVWSITDGTLVREFPGHESHIYSVMYHPSGESLITGELRGTVRQWEVASGNQVRTFDAKKLWSYNGGQQVDFGGVRALAMSPNGKFLACGGLHEASNPLGAVHDPLVLVFDWESQALVQSQIAEGLKGVVWRLCYLSDNTLAAVSGGSSGGHLIFWNESQPKDQFRFQLPNIVRDFDVAADGLRAVTVHHDKHARLLRLEAKPA